MIRSRFALFILGAAMTTATPVLAQQFHVQWDAPPASVPALSPWLLPVLALGLFLLARRYGGTRAALGAALVAVLGSAMYYGTDAVQADFPATVQPNGITDIDTPHGELWTTCTVEAYRGEEAYTWTEGVSTPETYYAQHEYGISTSVAGGVIVKVTPPMPVELFPEGSLACADGMHLMPGQMCYLFHDCGPNNAADRVYPPFAG